LKFLNILPAEKVVKLYRAEGKFRATLMHEFRQGHDDKREK
jgi:predicted ATPase